MRLMSISSFSQPAKVRAMRLLLCLPIAMTFASVATAQEAGQGGDGFIVTDVRLQGLQRVSAGTVFNIVTLEVGDVADTLTIRSVTRELFASGYFKDIRLARDNGVLIINVEERPAIESIEFEGNKAIKTEALLEGLAEQGLSEGEIFKQATLERVGLELERQYVAQGRYGANIETSIDELPRNRVDLKIFVEEGKNSGIRHINLVGTSAFTEEHLLDQMELKHPSLLSFYKNDDKYSREKLGGDLETLEGYYKDRGYADFSIQSTQVSITPDRRQVYITVGVEEGDVYEIGSVGLVGDLGDVKADDLERLILIREGMVFSQAFISATEERMTTVLGNSGFTFATASGVPTLNEDGTADVEFYVTSGQRAYVRRITFSGNALTQDEVMRREMRQMEGGWASNQQIDLSKVRLERLGYFRGVNVETPQVPGTDNQIDVNFNLEEQPSGSISATFGYSGGYGLILGANYNQSNMLGTGNSLGVGINWSEYQKQASFNFFNPYYTLDQISRGYNIFWRRLDYDSFGVADYSTDAGGAGVTFGFPIGETQRINFGFTAELTELTQGFGSALEIQQFIIENGTRSMNYKTSFGWASSTLNRGMFADRGASQQFALELSLPGSDLEFYKLTYSAERFFAITRAWTLRLRTELGYGDSYGETTVLPFYEHFYAGGFGSIRGFENRTLGPRSTPPLQINPITGRPIFFGDPDGDPFGGNLLVEGSAELIFPIPFVEDNRQFRAALFFDVGNVFNTNCPNISLHCFDFSGEELRYSVGLGVTWLTGMGPMTFSMSKAFQTQPFDEEEGFQFELGRTF
jgi:outer membrane protein insertion porin family